MGRVRRALPSRKVDTRSDSWRTPHWLAMALGWFDTDPASNLDSHILARRSYALDAHGNQEALSRFTIGNGLELPWIGSVWINPPYSNPLPWCVRIAKHDGPWAMLVKLETSGRWWHTLMSACDDWAPFKFRVKFERKDRTTITPNFCSALVWGGGWIPPADVEAFLWTRRATSRSETSLIAL